MLRRLVGTPDGSLEMNKTLPLSFAFRGRWPLGTTEAPASQPGGARGAADPARLRRGPSLRPGVSTVVVVADQRPLPIDQLALRLPRVDADGATLVVAMAAEASEANRLRQLRRDASVIVAPLGTSMEDLRGLAMREAPGDIVTMLDGALLAVAGDALPADVPVADRFA